MGAGSSVCPYKGIDLSLPVEWEVVGVMLWMFCRSLSFKGPSDFKIDWAVLGAFKVTTSHLIMFRHGCRLQTIPVACQDPRGKSLASPVAKWLWIVALWLWNRCRLMDCDQSVHYVQFGQVACTRQLWTLQFVSEAKGTPRLHFCGCLLLFSSFRALPLIFLHLA